MAVFDGGRCWVWIITKLSWVVGSVCSVCVVQMLGVGTSKGRVGGWAVDVDVVLPFCLFGSFEAFGVEKTPEKDSGLEPKR